MKEVEKQVGKGVELLPESYQEPARRPYTPPKLTVFGDVEELTRNAGNLGSDGVFTSRTAA